MSDKLSQPEFVAATAGRMLLSPSAPQRRTHQASTERIRDRRPEIDYDSAVALQGAWY